MAFSSPIASLFENLGASGGTSSAIDTTGADILFAAISHGGAPALSDSKSNTWTALTQRSGAFNRTILYYCVAPTVGSGHTFTLSGGSIYASIGVAAFSGAKQTSPFDSESGGNTAGSTHQPGSVTPSEDNEIVISVIGGDVSNLTPTIDAGFTRIGYVNLGSVSEPIGMAYLIQTSAAAANPTWTSATSGDLTGSNSCFKAAAVASGGPNRLIGGGLLHGGMHVGGRLVR